MVREEARSLLTKLIFVLGLSCASAGSAVGEEPMQLKGWFCPASGLFYTQTMQNDRKLEMMPWVGMVGRFLRPSCTSPWVWVGPCPPERFPDFTQHHESEIPAQEKCRQEEAERRERQRIEQNAAIEAQRKEQAETQKRQQEAVAEQVRMERERGYKRVTFDDFKLDGKQLAATEAKISVQGVYRKIGQIEILVPTSMAAAMALQTGADIGDIGIGLLTDDATRKVRKFFLDCRNNIVAAQLGCQLTVLGRATMCERRTLVGSTATPCLTVEDGWNLAQPR